MKFLLKPESGSYQIAFGTEALGEELDGGRGRYRLDILNASKKVDMAFILDPTEYDYFMAFYRSQAQRGAEPFQMDLIIDSSAEVECTCNFVPGSLKLNSQSGLAYTVACTMEVRQPVNPDELTDDTAIIDAYNASQGYTP